MTRPPSLVGQTARRYLPFLVLVLLQVVLVVIGDDSPTDVRVQGIDATGGRTAARGGTPLATATDQTAVASAGGSTGSGPSAAAPAPAAADGAARPLGTSGSEPTPGNAGVVQTPAAAKGGPQQLDDMGRPLTGDTSMCAGAVQEDVTDSAAPCMPRFEGQNGGATAPGVSADTVRIVFWHPDRGATATPLAAAGLGMTEAQAADVARVFEVFYNTHYDLYGRKVELLTYLGPEGDPIEERAEAKALVAKFQPFVVIHRALQFTEAIPDQLARLGVLSIGASGQPDGFYQRLDPYVWAQRATGFLVADMVAEYYCMRLAGKNATEAGDVGMHVVPRKLGILSSEDPDELANAKRLHGHLTGGMCQAGPEPPSMYTYTGDDDAVQGQASTVVGRMKNDGITTTFGALPFYGTMDEQRYFPENLIGTDVDDDFVGRFFAATYSAVQMQNTFGVGFYQQGHPLREHEYNRALSSVSPGYEAPIVAEGMFHGMQMFMRSAVYAGPNLNAETWKIGARRVPQIAGFTNQNPWPGWTCCNPRLQGQKVPPDGYGAVNDARQIYWDNKARSDQDGATGAWVGVDDSRRYQLGQWPAGEPKQP